MPGGSPEPENAEEEDQCQHCGRWYGRDGVLSHESHCEWAASSKRLHDLESGAARLRAGVDDVDDGPVRDLEDDGGDLDGSVDVAVVEPDAPEPDEPAVPDGGPSDPPTFDVDEPDVQGDDVGAGSDPTADPTTCPGCGSDSTVRLEDLDGDLLGPVPDEVQDADRICLACADVDDAGLRVEAFDEVAA